MAGSARDIQMREPKDTVSELNKLIKALQQMIETANTHEAALCQERDNLKKQVDYLAKHLFGASSEEGKYDIPGQLNLFNGAETTKNPVAALSEEVPPSQEEPEAEPRKKRTANEGRLKGLPAEQVFLDVPEEERICGVCGTLVETIGTEFVRRELKFIPVKVKVIEYYSANYDCPKYRKEAILPQIKRGKGSRAYRVHGMASTSTVAWIMYQKYLNGMPSYRQERDWKQCGANISRTTFANWIIANAQDFFTPMHAYFRKKPLVRSFAMAGETPVQVLHEPGRHAQTQSYVWLFRSGEDEGPSIILYKYAPTHARNNAVEFLEGCSGYLMCDGYDGYNKVPDAKWTACWTHIRRCLIDAIPRGKQLDYTQPSVQGVIYVNRLFEVEDRVRRKHAGDYEAIRRAKLKKEKPVIDGFLSWLEQRKPTRGSRLDKATTYIRDREPYLSRYLEDGRCSFSNNLSENTIRPSAVGRKG